MATLPATPTIIERRWIAAEYRRLPEGPPYYELEDRRLIEWPHRSGRHQKIVGVLCSVLFAYLIDDPIGNFWPGVEVELTPVHTYIPDLSFLLTANLERFADDVAIQGPPDLVVEVVSPSTAARDRSQKLSAYRQAGVPWYWLVESDTLLITEYRHTPEGYLVGQTTTAADTFAPALLPGLSFRMADWFGERNVEEESHE
jgi:Uma2 family endonuclease